MGLRGARVTRWELRDKFYEQNRNTRLCWYCRQIERWDCFTRYHLPQRACCSRGLDLCCCWVSKSFVKSFKKYFANLLSLHNGRGEHYTLNRRYPSSFINLMKTFNRYSHFAVKLFVCDISVFFFRVHDNESCNLIGSLRGPYFPISAHEQR